MKIELSSVKKKNPLLGPAYRRSSSRHIFLLLYPVAQACSQLNKDSGLTIIHCSVQMSSFPQTFHPDLSKLVHSHMFFMNDEFEVACAPSGFHLGISSWRGGGGGGAHTAREG